MLSTINVPQWRQILRKNFTSLETLAEFLELDEDKRKFLAVKAKFSLNLPYRLAEKIKKNCLEDPILKQFVPLMEESLMAAGFGNDPVGDNICQKTSKLLQKYKGRVLLVCSSACAMHCRYCFRQNYDYEVQEKGFAKELQLIAQDPTIREVILSGGDPLSLSDNCLKGLLVDLAAIPHLKMIRFHSRFPVGIPERIDSSFLKILEDCPLQIWFVLHSNHPRELDNDVLFAMERLRKQGVGLLNQSVLLKGVNDNIETLKELCEKLVGNGILPYYLHQLDKVQGAAHFEVDIEKGRSLVQELARQLPGYAIPRYVREVTGQPSKSLLA